MGTLVLHGIVDAGDTCIEEAEAFALAVLDGLVELSCGIDSLDGAVVYRYDGLVIFDTAQAVRKECDTDRVGIHFSTPVAGTTTSSTMMAATILSGFGFGPPEKIYRQINHGGDGADIIFTKEVNASA
jgi:hypothetical protein